MPQVLIKVLIAEVTHDNSSDFGVDFSDPQQARQRQRPELGHQLRQRRRQPANGGLVVSLHGDQRHRHPARRWQTQGKLDVLSRPYILASDNQQATITVGQEVPFITDTPIDRPRADVINTIQLPGHRHHPRRDAAH